MHASILPAVCVYRTCSTQLIGSQSVSQSLGILPCRVDHVHSPAENGWKEYQREYGYKQTGYGPQGSHSPPDPQQPKTSILGGLKDTAGTSYMPLPVSFTVLYAIHKSADVPAAHAAAGLLQVVMS